MRFLDDLTPENRAKFKKNVVGLSGFTEYYLYKPLQRYTFQVSWELALLCKPNFCAVTAPPGFWVRYVGSFSAPKGNLVPWNNAFLLEKAVRETKLNWCSCRWVDLTAQDPVHSLLERFTSALEVAPNSITASVVTLQERKRGQWPPSPRLVPLREGETFLMDTGTYRDFQ